MKIKNVKKVVIKKGTIITHTGSFVADILIENGIITNIGYGYTADLQIDAEGCLVLPGLIDPHVHFGFKSGEFLSSDTFETGSRAAAFGGVTTIIDFAVPEKDETLDQALVRRLEEAAGQCYVDYEVHVAITQVRDSLPNEIERCMKQGVFVFRLYMVYPELQLNDGDLYTILRLVKNKGGLVRIHAEDSSIINAKEIELIKEGFISPYSHYLSRPAFVEEQAVAKVLLLQRETGCPIYFNHISTSAAVKLFQAAKYQGQQVFVEVCPQYLFFTAEVYKKPDGCLYLVSPAFKTEVDRKELWRGLERGIVDTIGTDHCPYFKEQKMKYAKEYKKIPNGVPGVETTLPLLFTEWCRRRWPLERLVALCSYNAARIFRLYPRKGVIQPGADGDVVILDPTQEWEIRKEFLHMNVDWNPYEGRKCIGKVKTVLLRGQILVEDGVWKGEKALGQRVFKKGGQKCSKI